MSGLKRIQSAWPFGMGSPPLLETPARPLLLSFLVLLGILAFGPVLGVPFMWDDPQMILSNPYISAWTWDNIKHNFTHDVFNQGIPYFRPLQTLLNMVDFSLYGIRPWGYHLTNLLIHLFNIVLLFLVLEKVGFRRVSAFWVTGAFAVHPIIVQELMVVAGRAELLSSFFILLGLWGWLTEKRSGWVLSILCFPLAILSKESGVVLPFLIATVSLTRSTFKARGRFLLPHFALLAGYLFLRHRFVGEVAPVPGLADGLRFVFFQAPKILFVYVRLLFVPWPLHSHRYQPSPGWDSLLVLGGIAIGCAWGLFSPVRRKMMLFWVGWFFSFLIPKIPLLATNSLMLEHWVYVAGVGVYGPFMVWLSKTRWSWGAALPILCWMGIAQLNIHIRGSDALNYAYSARFSSSPWLRHNWARDLLQRGHPAEAAALFEQVIQRHPEDGQARNGLALAYLGLGRPDSAIDVLMEAQRLTPSDATVWINLSTVYLRTGDVPKALDCAHQAIALDSISYDAWIAQAECLRAMRRWSEAIDSYRGAISVNPAQCDARNNLAGLLVQSGDLSGAMDQMRTIARINPSYPGIKENTDRLTRLMGTPSSNDTRK
ncbi:MAG: tetratricopeptide repeat protein [Elusimicrobia bacterium]|nr:tetratricopeptide repeat protein [Elusimicrobiota bacterium]